MKVFITVVLVAFVAAESPPSNSYLPPSPNSNGYPSGGPELIAARSFNQGARGFGRSNQPIGGHQARFNSAAQPGFGQQALFGRKGFEDLSSEPANYNFGYAVNDEYEGTDFGHNEHRQNQRAEGEYHVVLPDGRKQTVSYEADEHGFKPRISYQDTANGNGYNDNAQNSGFGNTRAKGGY